jgi:hypothetical protein
VLGLRDRFRQPTGRPGMSLRGHDGGCTCRHVR